MDLEVNSGELISECRKQYGNGQFFPRTDGLRFEARRVIARREYLDAHPEINPQHREAILNAAITPGMTRADVIAAWGLLEEDTRLVFGHVTADYRQPAYAYFKGFDVGTRYALYFHEHVLTGVRETDEVVPPHERELDMRIAEEGNLFYFYDGNDGELRGSNVDQYNMDWDTAHLHLYTIEVVPRSSRYRIEVHLEAHGALEKYEQELIRLGYTVENAPADIRMQVGLSLISYPPPPPPPPVVESMAAPPAIGDDWRLLPAVQEEQTSAEPPAPEPAPIDTTLFDEEGMYFAPDVWSQIPPPAWFDKAAEGGKQYVPFPTPDDEVELLEVEWEAGVLFRVQQVPFSATVVTYDDLVEMYWEEGDPDPHFRRVVEASGNRTVRVDLRGSDPKYFQEFMDKIVRGGHYRHENRILVFYIEDKELDEEARNWIRFIRADWVYADTMTQE